MDRKRILILEDDEDMQEFYSYCWSDFSLLFVSTAEEALHELKLFHPDFIVADLILAGEMQGMDFIKDIREHRNEVPIIIVSANIGMDELNDAVSYHVSEVISKPLKKEQLQDLAKRKFSRA